MFVRSYSSLTFLCYPISNHERHLRCVQVIQRTSSYLVAGSSKDATNTRVPSWRGLRNFSKSDTSVENKKDCYEGIQTVMKTNRYEVGVKKPTSFPHVK